MPNSLADQAMEADESPDLRLSSTTDREVIDMVVAPPTQEAGPHASDGEGRTQGPPVLEEELARLAASVASDLDHIMKLLDPINRPTDAAVYMAHQDAWTALTTAGTMQRVIEHLHRRAALRSTDDHATCDHSYRVDQITCTKCGATSSALSGVQISESSPELLPPT